jgi:transcriptional regulator with XRE-family HTH domain
MTTLRAARVQACLTIEELARRSGLSMAFVWRLEHGRQRPSLQTAQQIARVLGVSTDELFRQDI